MGEEARPDRERFADWLRRDRGRLFAYILALVRNPSDADDVFQQTALTCWQRFGTFDPARDFLRWACGVARLEAAEFLRTRARDRLCFGDDLAADLAEAFVGLPENEVGDRQAALPGCLAKLPDLDRRLIAECYAPGADVAAVAARLGRPVRGVYNSLRRIRRGLFECIERAVARVNRG